MNKNLLLYVHFNKENKLSEHVIYQLQKMRPIFDEIFFISNSELSNADKEILENQQLFDGFMQRENKGYDFVAWSDAMKHYGFDKLMEYETVTVMNDTCFGPVFDFAPIFEENTANSAIDFWGITNNRGHKVNPWGDKTITLPDHIQSYFVSYKQNVVKSDSFQKFWSNVEVLDDVVKVIIQYETAMTKYFEDAGFKSAVLFDTRKEDWAGMLVHDFSVFNLSALVKRQIPFLKIKAFTYGAENVYTPIVFDELKRISDYPTEYIVNHMTWVDYPDRAYMLDDKILNISENSVKFDKKVGIHLHVFYVDLLQEFLDNFDQYVGNYDLFITTDQEKKKQEIQEIVKNRENIKTILVTPNKGRDVLPWMKIASNLTDYEIAGHFHTKKSADNQWIVGESWRQEIVENLILPAQNIFSAFQDNEQLGLVISDVPSFFQAFRGPIYMDEEKIWDKMLGMWNKINFAEKKELKQKDSYTMSYGTMIWYRPKALNDLLVIDIADEIPAEPLPYDSILHAFERLLVYVSWGNHYDFRISKTFNQQNGFAANVSLNRTLRELKQDNKDFRLRELSVMFYKKLKFMIKYNLLKMIGKR